MPFSCSMIGTPARHVEEPGRPPGRGWLGASIAGELGAGAREDLRPPLRMVVSRPAHGRREAVRLPHS
jgi:hypothetical protein